MSKIIGIAFLPLTITVTTMSLIKDAYDGYGFWSGKEI